jgi:hypothetical protein
MKNFITMMKFRQLNLTIFNIVGDKTGDFNYYKFQGYFEKEKPNLI